ncbi:rhodanese-like domain-containing protein [Bosea lathyri]|uniref:Rhodanese-related sulfurtransferase n=1 Tax=Bosea lathyri TaxID=1036778 RepID=A0A1H5XKI8_9HYPH|nr:rhodanese-like domain-containing protein [Bosea lathyri]SEG12153.1 Rhodanese-related sulfurtransferase [Bosea lathyri]
MTVNDLDINDIKAGLDAGSILIVDVREPHEFAAGHIPGSVSRPLSQFDPADLPNEPGKRIVLSCAAGVRSLRALAFAQSAGLDIDSHYIGGFKDWVMSGEPVEH